MSNLPERYLKFKQEFPEIAAAYENLGSAIHNSSPLDEKTRTLIKIAFSAGAGLEGALHSHTRKAIEAGITGDELKHTVLLGMTTIGFPATMAAMSWLEDIINK